MKIALYMEDDLSQIILTPASAAERAILERLRDAGGTIEIKRGAFYHCQGGWTRQNSNDDSTILVLRPKGGAA